MIGWQEVKSAGVQSTNKLQRFYLMLDHQDSITSDGR